MRSGSWRRNFQLAANIVHLGLTTAGALVSLPIKLNRNSDIELRRQLYHEIRRLIGAKKLRAGMKLPSSRDLAEQLGVSRKTVKEAYSQLLTEGFLESSPRSGTFVAGGVQGTEPPRSAQKSEPSGHSPTLARLSAYGNRMAQPGAGSGEASGADISFFSWQPSFNTNAHGQWQTIFLAELKRAMNSVGELASHPFGLTSLREQIAQWVERNREIKCSADQVALVAGYGPALDLVARLHTSSGDTVLVEDPTYPPSRDLFASYGAELIPIAVDQQGIEANRIIYGPWSTSSKILVVTPAHQFPAGCVLTMQRRVDLLRWANEVGCLIVEDDYDSEFNFDGQPVPALTALDTSGCTVYLGSFKKILPATVSIDFMIIPEALVPVYAQAMWFSGAQISLAVQSALAEFIRSGHLDKQVRRSRTAYRRRRDVLLAALNNHLGANVQVVADNVGLHVVIRVVSDMSDTEFTARAAAAGVELVSTRSFYAVDPGDTKEYILGYATLSATEIEEGVSRLAALLKQETP